MHTAGRGGRRWLRWPLSRAERSRDIERCLGRSELSGLKGKILLARRGGRVVGRCARSRVHRRGVTIDRNLVDGLGGRGHNVSGHDVLCCVGRSWEKSSRVVLRRAERRAGVYKAQSK
jgi:hypothetical protein